MPIRLPETLIQFADEAIRVALENRATTDPLFDAASSAFIGTCTRLVQRHGLLIQAAIAEALETAGFAVAGDVRFPVTDAADALLLSTANDPKKRSGVHLPLGDQSKRIVDVDIVAVDETRGLGFAVAVKRGCGSSDAARRRNAERDLGAIALLLRSYARQHGYHVDVVRTVVVDWYGQGGFRPDISVTRKGVDAFFGVPIAATVDAATAYLSTSLAKVLPGLLRKLAPGVPCAQAAAPSDDTPVAAVRRPLGSWRPGPVSGRRGQ